MNELTKNFSPVKKKKHFGNKFTYTLVPKTCWKKNKNKEKMRTLRNGTVYMVFRESADTEQRYKSDRRKKKTLFYKAYVFLFKKKKIYILNGRDDRVADVRVYIYSIRRRTSVSL